MSNNVVKLFLSVPEQLRDLADQVEAGEYPAEATIIIGGNIFRCKEKYCADPVGDVLWDCNRTIYRLMVAADG